MGVSNSYSTKRLGPKFLAQRGAFYSTGHDWVIVNMAHLYWADWDTNVVSQVLFVTRGRGYTTSLHSDNHCLSLSFVGCLCILLSYGPICVPQSPHTEP